MSEFKEFSKIARLSRPCTITEKLDGTNAAVVIERVPPGVVEDANAVCRIEYFDIYAQSRSRFIKPGDDNFGFAAWVDKNAAELLDLGEGTHFGEWWGAGVGRRYGLSEKRFSLFNTARWSDYTTRPACCHVVPVLYEGLFTSDAVQACVGMLRKTSSFAAPGFMNPEGVIVWHEAARTYFKKTLDKDEEWKGKSA